MVIYYDFILTDKHAFLCNFKFLLLKYILN